MYMLMDLQIVALTEYLELPQMAQQRHIFQALMVLLQQM
jgi:hypothetical protein